ncbi:hypothetical protein LTR84_010914 [Exophiala bonariae]|uniref:Uncharacterized protein n=1 Tax=Exophiala bonariae TaxID=1690606 RepID=A0AAV9NJA2_9EURO|nr:hypothetical protein LTR84_010914 [Exophiala bonariae]
MVLLKLILSLGLMGATAVNAIPTPEATTGGHDRLPGCGEVNVLLTGLPPYHPLVIQQGHDPNGTEIGLRESQKMAVDAGYNVRCEFYGNRFPE